LHKKALHLAGLFRKIDMAVLTGIYPLQAAVSDIRLQKSRNAGLAQVQTSVFTGIYPLRAAVSDIRLQKSPALGRAFPQQ
jgi:hypothetical protein